VDSDRKNKFVLVAEHPAFGEVTFTVLAKDRATAFSQWKQIVFSSRQWIVKSNEEEL
jgi:hypothetical protein